MNNINHLPTDLMSLILSIRTEEMKKDLDKQIEEWKEDSENSFIYMTNEIHFYFTEEGPIFNNLGLVEDAKLFSPYRVLQDLRSAREDRINPIEEDFGNYYN